MNEIKGKFLKYKYKKYIKKQYINIGFFPIQT